MKVVPDETSNARILGKDFIIKTVWAGCAWEGVCLRRRLGEGSGSVPSVSVHLISSRWTLKLTLSMKAAAISSISSCRMKETSPWRIYTELVAPIGRLVRHKRPRGI